jgi:hypothetical protein
VYTPSISAPVTSPAPNTSAPRRTPTPTSLPTSLIASNAVATPIGRFTKKIQCQLIACVMTPPASSPIEAPAEATKLKMPIALACSAGSGSIVTIIPRITADAIAPPSPWMERATINVACL